jgi:hypothetical protein
MLNRGVESLYTPECPAERCEGPKPPVQVVF